MKSVAVFTTPAETYALVRLPQVPLREGSQLYAKGRQRRKITSTTAIAHYIVWVSASPLLLPYKGTDQENPYAMAKVNSTYRLELLTYSDGDSYDYVGAILKSS